MTYKQKRQYKIVKKNKDRMKRYRSYIEDQKEKGLKMSCKQIGNGFVCSDIGGYMSKEISYWQKNIEEYKETFIEYMDRSSKCGVEHARLEVEAHIENVGIDNLETPEYDADECMSYWDGD